MHVHFTKSFEVHVKATARRMVDEKLDVCEIPEGNGMFLVRRGSAEYKRRLADPVILMVPVPEPLDGCHFVVCTS